MPNEEPRSQSIDEMIQDFRKRFNLSEDGPVDWLKLFSIIYNWRNEHMAADVEPKRRWIPVTERLPESAERYLVMRFDYVAKAPFYDLLWFENGRWWNRHFEGDYAVTHWMPLPELPKEDKEEEDAE